MLICLWSVQTQTTDFAWMSSIVTIRYTVCTRMSFANIFRTQKLSGRKSARTHFNRMAHVPLLLIIHRIRSSGILYIASSRRKRTKFKNETTFIHWFVCCCCLRCWCWWRCWWWVFFLVLFFSAFSSHSISIQSLHLPCHYCLKYLSTHLCALAQFIVCIQ